MILRTTTKFTTRAVGEGCFEKKGRKAALGFPSSSSVPQSRADVLQLIPHVIHAFHLRFHVPPIPDLDRSARGTRELVRSKNRYVYRSRFVCRIAGDGGSRKRRAVVR